MPNKYELFLCAAAISLMAITANIAFSTKIDIDNIRNKNLDHFQVEAVGTVYNCVEVAK